jgi:Leucine-rich repeat (LRR) protein
MTDNNLKMFTINGKKYNNNITKLNLSYNELTELPKEIGKLSIDISDVIDKSIKMK